MKTVQIDCLLEISIKEDLSREEILKRARSTLNLLSYHERGEALQIDNECDWHIINEDGEEE